MGKIIYIIGIATATHTNKWLIGEKNCLVAINIIQ